MAKKRKSSKNNSSKSNSRNKITKYRKPLNVNIGMIIFSVIFFYVVISVIMYFQTSHIVRYEVEEGSLATNNIYRGVIIRDETVVFNQSAGYVNYYAREGERVAKNALVYIVDETGRLSENLEAAAMGENSLSEKDLAEFKSEIINFVHSFDCTHFESAYDAKYALKNTVLKLANVRMLDNISDLSSAAGGNIINYFYAPTTGIVSYWTDGYENLKAQDVTADTFDTKKDYEKKQILSNSLMAAGDAVYKLSTNENWSLVIPVDAARGAELLKEEFVKVRFLKNQYESWGEVDLFTNADGNTGETAL